jgi:hypothetical protein
MNRGTLSALELLLSSCRGTFRPSPEENVSLLFRELNVKGCGPVPQALSFDNGAYPRRVIENGGA